MGYLDIGGLIWMTSAAGRFPRARAICSGESDDQLNFVCAGRAVANPDSFVRRSSLWRISIVLCIYNEKGGGC